MEFKREVIKAGISISFFGLILMFLKLKRVDNVRKIYY